MSIKDPMLMARLSKNINDTVIFNLQQKAYQYTGDKIVNTQFHRLMKERERIFLSYFKENGTEKQVTVLNNTSDIPYNGFSYFKLKYEKEMPVALQQAYRRMIEINNEESRSRYKGMRESASKIDKQGFVARDSLLLKKE